MIVSMTGYGEGTAQGEDWSVAAKIKTLNHRYLEIHLRGLDDYEELELRVRECLQRKFHRGRVEVTLQIEHRGERAILFDPEAVRPYVESLVRLTESLGMEEPVKIDHLLRLGALRPQPPDPEGLWAVLNNALQEAIDAAWAMRRREGEALADELHAILTTLRAELAEIQARAPELKALYRERLLQRAQELAVQVELDPERLEQEAVIWAERSDITEELARMDIHIQAAADAMRSAEPAGRTLDFLAQELNREANTIASKARDSEIAPRAVALKTHIERFREQVRNVE